MASTRTTRDYEQGVRHLIGPRLKEARATAGLSQKGLVEALTKTLRTPLYPPPITQASISNYESGARSPALWVAVLLCEVLDLDITELIEGVLDV
jgi:transcriptional regulator with XRE-family HTH domain